MKDKDLKKLKRKDLLELLIEQGSEMERLQEKLNAAEAQAQSRELQLRDTENAPQAALGLNGVFEAAQEAADIYLNNIRRTDADCERRRAEAEREAAAIIAEAQQKAAKIEGKAKMKAEAYWKKLSRQLEQFYAEHEGLKAMLDIETAKHSE